MNNRKHGQYLHCICMARNYVCIGVWQVHTHHWHECVSCSLCKMSFHPSQQTVSYHPFGTAVRCLPKDRIARNWWQRLSSVDGNGGTRYLWVMSHKLFFAIDTVWPMYTTRIEYNVDCGMYTCECVGYAQNESENGKIIACAPRAHVENRISNYTTNSVFNHSLALAHTFGLLAYSPHISRPTTAPMCEENVVLVWLRTSALSFSALLRLSTAPPFPNSFHAF